jgi:uncharacterized protein involved in outer membrane biogenesis
MLRRITKNLLIALLLIIAVGSGVLYYGTQALLEYYRPQLVAEVSDSVGCPVSYSRATIKLTPALEVVLHDVSVMGATLGFEVSAPYIAAEVKMNALLDRHLDFDKLTLLSPSIVLITGGSSNSNAPTTQPTSPSLSAPTPQPTSAPLLSGIDSIAIDSGRIAKRNAAGVQTVVLEDLHIQSGLTTQGSSITVMPSEASFVLPVGTGVTKRLSITASLQQLAYTLEPRTISIHEALIATDSSSLSLSGSMNLSTGSITASLKGSKVGLSGLQQLIGAKALSGTADLQATVTLDETSMQIGGTLGLSGGRITASTGESYGVTSLTGPFSLQRTKGQAMAIQSAALAVQGFSYTDPNVSLNHLNGTLSNITGSIGDDGATTFTVVVHGTNLDLSSGPFIIKKIGNVDAPLTIKVPVGPGYSVIGPVKAAGVDMTFHGRPFAGTSGSVDMLVSNAVLRFITKGIQTQSNGIPVSVSGTVEINDSSYSIQNLVGQLAGGSLASDVTIQRFPKNQVQAEVLAKGLDVSAVKSLFSGDPKASFSGRIDHLSVKATARKDDLLSSATGEGVIEITDGSVARAQFDRRVVGLIKAIPVVGEAVSFTSNATDSSTYEMQGGMMKELTADFTLGSGRVNSKNIKAQGKFSNLIGSGDIKFNGDLNITASAVYLEQNLRALAGPIQPLGALFGTIGKIEIPLLIQGSIGSPKISADLSRLQDVSMPGRAISPILRGLGSVVDSATGN